MEVFRRSAARSRSTDAPDVPAEGDGGMAGGAEQLPGTAGAGGGTEDLDDLMGDLEDLIAGGGRPPAGEGDGEADGSADGTMTGGAGGSGEGEDMADAGPWHRPGAAGQGRDPSSEEVYGDGTRPGSDQAGGGAPTQTSAERHAELERVLAEAMGDFDGRILDERAVILARRGSQPDGASADESASGGAAGSSSAGRDEAGRRTAPAPPTPGQQQAGGGTTGSVGNGETLPVPDDVGDGADDDVVARQLREAAMNETDPELREKLWDEYRRYVAGRR